MNAIRPGQMQAVPVRYTVTQLGGGTTQQGVSYPGGLDQTTPSLRLQPGALRDVLNFECAQSGGYSRVVGYERIDGRPAPSAAVYQVIQLDFLDSTPAVGASISQGSQTVIPPGAPQVVITGSVAIDGSYTVENVAGVVVQGQLTVASAGTPPTATVALVVSRDDPYLVVTQVVGNFVAGGPVNGPGSVLIGNAITRPVSISPQQDAQYTAAAADIYRALIGPVPGTGAVSVVSMAFSGVNDLFAFRANAGATAMAVYKASSSGWTLVPFFNVVSFTGGGTAVPMDGDTLTQGGVTATIKRVMWQSGAWTGTAMGTFVVTNPSGGAFAAGAATSTSGATVTLSGPQTLITMAIGGKFEFVKCNFAGQAVTRRIYGCDAVNQCFEFDGETLAPIATGLSPDAPNHIAFHKNYLFVSQGSSIFHCGVGTPFKWYSVDGGGEIATGDVVTGMLTLPGSQTTATLGVYLQTNVSFLYGTDPTTFNYVTFNTGLGALPRTAQNLFDTFIFDNLGVVTLRTTLNWGNFLPTSLTKNILPFILAERSSVSASTISRDKSQYRVFFSDGYGLWITMINQQYLGAGVVLFPNPVNSCDQNDLVDGSEVSYFGSSDGLGYVYQLERGTSFDGAPLPAYGTLAWDSVKSPRILKRFRAASIEMQGSGFAEVQFSYQLGYGSALIGQPSPVDVDSNFSTPRWDNAAISWDGSFTWDGVAVSPSDVDVTGTGENIQATFASGTNYIPAYTLDSIIWHYSMRRGIRV